VKGSQLLGEIYLQSSIFNHIRRDVTLLTNYDDFIMMIKNRKGIFLQGHKVKVGEQSLSEIWKTDSKSHNAAPFSADSLSMYIIKFGVVGTCSDTVGHQ
jgi:hypothetical protein